MTRKQDTFPDWTPQERSFLEQVRASLEAKGAPEEEITAKLQKAEAGLLRGRQQDTAQAPSRRQSFPPAAEESIQLTLPGFVPKSPGNTSLMSNYIARTPLFAPIKRGRRAMLDKVKLPSPAGLLIHYTGKQLDMGDQDVFLQAIKLAAGEGPECPIIINRAAFLRGMGWKSQSDRAYQWLDGVFERLSTGRMFLETERLKASLPMLGALILDKDTGEYTFSVPKETMALFAGQAYGYVDLDKRRALEKRVDLAKWLQSYAGSHEKGPHSVSLANLHKWSGYQGRMRDFRVALIEALNELARVGILQEWSFKQRRNFVNWTR